MSFRATARPMLPILPAALHWARPADTGQRLCAASVRDKLYRVTPCRSSSSLRARSAPSRHAGLGHVRRSAAPHGAERAGRAAAEREPSAMLPAASAALAERSRGGAARFASTPRTEPGSRASAHGFKGPNPDRSSGYSLRS